MISYLGKHNMVNPVYGRVKESFIQFSYWPVKIPLTSCHQIPAGVKVFQVSTFNIEVFICRNSSHILIYVNEVVHVLYNRTISLRFHVDLALHCTHLYLKISLFQNFNSHLKIG